MAFPIRRRAIPQCSACLRSYAWTSFAETGLTQANGLRQQVRGKKNKATVATGTIPARLLKDLPGFGRKGAIVPLTRGEMRNSYFPRRIADYVPQAELRQLRATNTAIERDYAFGRKDNIGDATQPLMMPLTDEPSPAPVRKAPEVEKLSAERSMELLEIFIPHRMDFYRQPIVEEKVEEEAQPEKEERAQRTASSAAADLLAARSQAAREKPKPKLTGAIYGSVSTHDILVAVRAAIATNDEAARVIVMEQDIHFMDEHAAKENRLKLVGDFTIEIKLKGAETSIRRTVRVIPQDV